jgi:hypothetical protein
MLFRYKNGRLVTGLANCATLEHVQLENWNNLNSCSGLDDLSQTARKVPFWDT